MRLKHDKVSDIAAYDIIRTPVVTEKSTGLNAYGQYVFTVDVVSTKPQIKQAVEKVFGVKVLSVNTLNKLGKNKRFKGRLGTRPSTKRAIVRLAEGQSIDIGVGV